MILRPVALRTLRNGPVEFRGVPVAIAEAIDRGGGIQAITTDGTDQCGVPDTAIKEFATRSTRLVWTASTVSFRDPNDTVQLPDPPPLDRVPDDERSDPVVASGGVELAAASVGLCDLVSICRGSRAQYGQPSDGAIDVNDRRVGGAPSDEARRADLVRCAAAIPSETRRKALSGGCRAPRCIS
jgi:hypothetical protein